jgi:hypothetical protein
MKLVIEKNLSNNNYEVSIDIVNILPEETELFSDYGAVSINLGGKLLDDDLGTTELAALGDLFKRVPTDLPITKVFSQAQYGENAEKVANSFARTTSEKIQAAITELKTKQDSFSGTSEVIL